MKSIVAVGSLLASLTLSGCGSSREEAPKAGEPRASAEKSREVAAPSSKFVLGPQSPEPPIEPSPTPSLPANVKEGMERKDPEPGPDMTKPADAPK